mgnify:CR=1 FL=1
MRPEYELTLLLKKDESECPQDDRIRTIFVIKNKENGGRKRLAYPIDDKDGKRHEFGHFVYYDLVKRDDTENYFLTRLLDQDPDVLRYLLVAIRKV